MVLRSVVPEALSAVSAFAAEGVAAGSVAAAFCARLWLPPIELDADSELYGPFFRLRRCHNNPIELYRAPDHTGEDTGNSAAVSAAKRT